jgi:hypothetical protein
MDAIAIILAGQLTRSEAQSALPHAPVEPPDDPRPARSLPFRRATATALYRLAERVEPRVTPVLR